MIEVVIEQLIGVHSFTFIRFRSILIKREMFLLCCFACYLICYLSISSPGKITNRERDKYHVILRKFEKFVPVFHITYEINCTQKPADHALYQFQTDTYARRFSLTRVCTRLLYEKKFGLILRPCLIVNPPRTKICKKKMSLARPGNEVN